MKDVIITPPDGYEIDEEKSTFECIKFRPKGNISYADIAEELFKGKRVYYVADDGKVDCDIMSSWGIVDKTNPMFAPTAEQLKKILALNKLLNVAYYFNNIEDADVIHDYRYELHGGSTNFKDERIVILEHSKPYSRDGVVYFKTEKSAEKAIRILGEDTVKQALYFV